MADDLDDLLDEVEESLSHGKGSNHNNRGGGLSESVKTDDLKDLLEELDPLPSRPALGSTPPPTPAPHTTGGCGRCSSPLLGGTSLPRGMSTGATSRACERLRCVKCDQAVVVVEGFSWTPTTDYLFLRNNYPDLARLRARLEPRRGTRAYACQCQHRALAQPCRVTTDRALKWVCAGHS